MRLYEKILIIIIILASLGLYELKGLGIVVRLLDISTIGLIILALFVWAYFGPQKERVRPGFRTPIILLLIGVFISSFAADLYHNQPLHLTLYQQRHMYAFLFYFLLIYMAPKQEWIVNLLFYFGVIGGLFFLLQYFLYPTVITDAKIFFQRGTLRINVPGAIYMHIAFFISINRFFITFNKKYAFAAALLLAVAILSAYRSTVFMYIFISFAYMLFGSKVKKKVFLFSLYALSVIAAFFAFQSLLMEMQVSAERESQEGASNIRYRSAEYYLSSNKDHPFTFFLGNGEPTQRSAYGLKISSVSQLYGYYLSDIGIIGFYFKFGLLASLAVLFMMLKVLLTPIKINMIFLKLFFAYQFFLILNTILPFEYLSGIIAVCLLLYLYDRHLSMEKNT